MTATVRRRACRSSPQHRRSRRSRRRCSMRRPRRQARSRLQVSRSTSSPRGCTRVCACSCAWLHGVCDGVCRLLLLATRPPRVARSPARAGVRLPATGCLSPVPTVAASPLTRRSGRLSPRSLALMWWRRPRPRVSFGSTRAACGMALPFYTGRLACVWGVVGYRAEVARSR